MGWAGLTNGELLARAEVDFDVFVTVDTSLPFQQQLSKFRLATLLLRAPSNQLTDLEPLIPLLLASLSKAKRGEVHVVGER